MESAEEKEFKSKKEEQELAVQRAIKEKGWEFGNKRREKNIIIMHIWWIFCFKGRK